MARRMGALHIRKVYDTGANRVMSSGESAVKCTLEGNLRVCLPIHTYFESEKNKSSANRCTNYIQTEEFMH